jgi:LPS export ABC transporter protein LptC
VIPSPSCVGRPSARLALLLCALTLPASLSACGRRPPPAAEGSLPFVFRSLNLRQQDPQGRPSWQLTSPEARYDLSRRVAQALRPRGVIYAEGKPLYRLSAESGTVINDGEAILLEGGIRVEQLAPQPLLIRASRVRWLPPRKLMLIDRHPEVFDDQSRLTAQRARFLLDRNRLELLGSPRLERWSSRFDPLVPAERGSPEVVVNVSLVHWEPRTGWLQAQGPVSALRRPPGSPSNRLPQTLTATALEANTLRQEYRLKGAVQFRDPAEAMQFDGTDLRIDGRERRIESERPFLARRGTANARGESVRLFGSLHTVEIPSGCWLQRPGESLRAGRCRWNWQNQDIEAQGQLVFERSANRQSTRAELLRGRLGASGQVELSNPGARVVSRFQVPKRSGPPGLPQRRRGAEPVRL